MASGARFILALALLPLLPSGWSAGQTVAVSTVPPQAEQPYGQGMRAFQKGDLRTAIRKLRLAVKYAPKSPLTHHSLGRAFLADGQVDAAVREFRNAIALGPTFTEAYLSMARALERGARTSTRQFSSASTRFASGPTGPTRTTNWGWRSEPQAVTGRRPRSLKRPASSTRACDPRATDRQELSVAGAA